MSVMESLSVDLKALVGRRLHRLTLFGSSKNSRHYRRQENCGWDHKYVVLRSSSNVIHPVVVSGPSLEATVAVTCSKCGL